MSESEKQSPDFHEWEYKEFISAVEKEINDIKYDDKMDKDERNDVVKALEERLAKIKELEAEMEDIIVNKAAIE